MPIPLPDVQVDQIRQCMERRLAVEPCSYLLQPGRRVRLHSGPLCGLEGVIVRKNGKTRFVISVDLIMRSVAVSVDSRDLESIEDALPAAA
jgi:transcription antitermination factor NusG